MRRKELLLLSIGIFLTVLASLVADVYHVNTEAKIREKEEAPKLKDYKINKELLNLLEKKKK